MRTIIRSGLQYHFLVITLAAVLVVVGINQIGSMPLDVLPEYSPPFVEIQTEALGLSAEEVENLITVPMEQDLLAGVAWLDVIHSKSVPGLSSVVIYFEPGTDLNRARQMVSERLAQAAVGIPHVSKPPAMIQPTSSASRFMIVGLSSKDLSLIEMSVLARWTIGPRLLGVPGVANVAIWGNRDQQLQVLVDPEQLQDWGVTLEQIIETTGNSLWVSPLSFLEASTPGTGGFIETPNQRLGVWHVLPISSPEELAKVPVERTAFTLGEVTRIVEDHQPLIGDGIKNDAPNLLLVIEKLPGTNILDVTKGVEAAITALRPGFSSIDFDATIFRPASFVEIAITNITQTLVVAAILAVLLLGFLFYGWRSALISLISIPVSLIAALYVLQLRGATFNAMTLAGLVIALGVIIDDAIVDIDHIVQRLRQNRHEDNPKRTEAVILEAASETRGTLFLATLIILLAASPIFFLSGVSGTLLQSMATSYVLAILAAMVVSLTVTPVLSLWLLSNANLDKRDVLPRLRGAYEKMVKGFAEKPGVSYALVMILVVLSLVAVPFLGQGQFVPAFKEPYVTIQMDGIPGTSREEMDRIVSRTSSELRTVSGVQNVAAHVGRAVLGDEVVGINSADIWVSIASDADYDATLSAIQDTVSGYPGMERQVQTYITQRLGESLVRNDGLYTLRVYGDEHDILSTEAEKIQQVLAGIPGVDSPQAVLPSEEPTLEIKVDLNSAQRYGVKPGDVRRAAAILLSGLQVGSLFEEQKVFDVVVWSVPEKRQNISDINNLLIDTPGGGHVKLSEVADVHVASSPTVINREGISPYLDVVFKINGRNVSAVLSDVQAAMSTYAFPLEYHAEIKHDYLAQQATRRSILVAGFIALIGIFLLLQAAARSWGMALALFLSVFATLSGGLLTAFLSGSAGSTVTLFGLFAVLAIGARNATLLIRHYSVLEQGGQSFGPELVLRGASERFVPVVMTALTTFMVLIPFVVFGYAPGQEVFSPIAIVILGGVVTSTFINLFIVPALYLRYGEARETDLGFEQIPAVVSET